MAVLDISGKHGMAGGLQGPLPAELTRATGLAHLGCSQNKLSDAIPSLPATLTSIALQNNGFKLVSSARFMTNSVVLLFNNLLSCHLPMSGSRAVALSLSVLGNHVQWPRKEFPPWVAPIEQDNFFWTSNTEGYCLAGQAVGTLALLAVIVGACLGYEALVVISRWHGGSGSQNNLAQASARLLHFMARACLVRAAFLQQFLLQWDLYKCPWTLAIASALDRAF